jgi:tartrate dehydratase beta subunit/fumarate hydratase class I family protein
MPECLWVYDVEDFGPMIVTIDSHGNNMTKNVKEIVTTKMKKILEEMEG